MNVTLIFFSTKMEETAITIEPVTANNGGESSVVPLSYSQWPLDMLIQREKNLTDKIEVEGLAIDRSESSDVVFLLSQHKYYQRLANVLSWLSKIIGAAGPISSVITTALGAPNYSNYILSGITAVAVPLHHFSEQLSATAANYDRQARVVYNNDVLDLQKVRAARKKQQLQSSSIPPLEKQHIRRRNKKSK